MKKRLVALLVLALVTVLVLASCGDPIGDWLNQFLDTPPVEETKEEYAVYFLAGEGIGVPSQTVEEGSLVTRPEDPYKEGYLFDGWYKDAEYTVAWNFDTDTVTKNTIIYGKWVDHTHSGGTATCTEKAICEVCDHAYGSLLDHVGGTATCTGKPVCEVCGNEYGSALGHDVVVIEGTAPTCTETGLTDGAYCTRCDAAAAQEVIPALGHTVVVDEAVAPTCTETGLTAGSHCSACDTVLEAQEVVPATGHTWGEWIVDAEPTEDADGSKHRECACGERETIAIPALNHTHSYTSEVTTAPTCTEAGVKTFTCGCGDTYTEAVPATGHTADDAVVENNVDATCAAAGSYDTVVYCSVCDAELSRVTTEVPALGHKDENGDFKCDSECGTVVEPADGTVLTFEQAKALANLFAHDKYTTNKYYVTGIITEVYNTQYGNIKLEGTDFVIYGLYSADGKTRYDAMTYKPVKGDEITVYGVVGKYNTTLQMKNGWLDEVVAHDHDYSEATCKVLATCSICGGTTGELAEHVYVDGICSVCGHDKDAVITDITFELGANGKAEHSDGTDTTEDKTYTETVNGYTLTITSTAKMYNGGRDAKGNSCLKFGTSSKTGNMSFTVPEDIVKVVIYVSGYKTATSTKIKVNGTEYTVTTASNNGEYTAIEVDTTTTKTVTFETVTYRAMVNSIVFVLGATEEECTHVDEDHDHLCDECDEVVSECVEGTPVVENNVAPNCTVAGSYETVVYCSVCGEELSRETTTVDATGHDYEAVVTAPDCVNGGYTTYTCDCGHSYVDDETDALGHAWGEWIVDTEATEEADGLKHHVCGTCGEVEEMVIPSLQHEHRYTYVVTDPTCTEKGYTTHTCRCGDSYVDTYVDALGHTAGETTVENNVDPTCTVAGSYENVVYCTVCEVELSRTTVPVDALGHDYDEAVTAPTCEAKGYTTYTCACGDTKIDTYVDALGHKDENGDFKCDNDCGKVMEPADGTTLTLEQAKALANLFAHDKYTTNKYYVTGIITEVYNTQYGNIKLEGTDFVIYGLYSADGKTRYDAMTYKPVKGDEITVYGVVGKYNTTLQMKNGWLDDVVAHEHDWDKEATCTVSATCEICGATNTAPHTPSENELTCTSPITCTVCEQVIKTVDHVDENKNGRCDVCKTSVESAGEDQEIIFQLGTNGSASHSDGTDTTEDKTYTETVNGYTLTITSTAKMYNGGRDAKGNSCLKFGTSSKTGNMSFTVPENVTKVIIYVSGYKGATSTNIKINGKQYTVKTASDTGEYTAIEIDTTTTKTVNFETVTYRAMVNTIVFKVPGEVVAHTHNPGEVVEENRVESTCTVAGSYDKVVYCTDADCGEQVSRETIELPLKEHIFGDWIVDLDPTEDAEGSKHRECACGETETEVIPKLDHTCKHVCDECGKCTDADCNETACADKCEGHKVVFSENTTINLSSTGVHFEGNTGVYEGLEIDATSGKFADNGSGWVQVNTGAVIKLNVLDGAEVSVVAHSSANSFTITVENGVCTIVATANDYLKSITVNYKHVYTEETTIDLSATGVHFEGNTGVYEGLEIDATNGKFKDHNGWTQVNAGTVITLNVFEGARVSVTAYSSADNFTIAVVDGVCTITAVGNDYLKAIIITAASVEPECDHVDTDDHKCDKCGETLSECADVNPHDHECDTCGKDLSVCKDDNNDHKCDICGDTMSQCADNNDDHKCDICGDTMSQCADNNDDHKCDLCGKELSKCDDGNKDHNCDLCGTELSKCDDGDCNHFCDLCGERTSDCSDDDDDHCCEFCGDPVSECADDNHDHKCDVCGETLSQCADNNDDHNCDVCGTQLSECVDDDRDHECDLCFKSTSDCADENSDHKCDICGATLSKCADEDQNHYCDICGIQNSQCVDLPPYDHNCDWCGEKMSECVAGEAVIENRTKSTCSVAGSYDTVVYCSTCGDELSRETTTLPIKEHTLGNWEVYEETDTSVEYRRVCECGHFESKTSVKVTLYYYTTWSNVNLYAWIVDPVSAGWPGSAMTAVEGKDGWFTATLVLETVEGLNVIFNNGSAQTSDLQYTGLNYWVGDTAYATLAEAEEAINNAEPPKTNVVYLVPNANWKQDNARYAVYTWDGGDQWFDMTDSDGDGVWEAELPASISNIIFCRMNPSTTANNWNNKWNQSADLKVQTNGTNCYTVKAGTWDKGGGTWSTYTPAVHEHEYAEVVTAPTCEAEGYTTYTCECGDTYTGNKVAALGHSYESVVTAPDCVNGGYTTYTCACGNSYVADETEALGHATEVEYWTYNNKLYLVPVCGCLTEKVLVDTTEALLVSNEADLVYLLTHGFNVKLDADIDLTATIDIEGAIVTLDLNGKTLKADWESDGLVEVIHVHDASHLTIVGEGNVISGGTYTAETNSVISCRVYSMLTIKGGNYYSASCGDVIFCETSSIVEIEGGHFEAAEDYYGTWYVLDIDEEETYNRGQFVVTGGTFVNFDPANHTNDSDYTNKVADGYHSIGNNGVYTVSAHSYDAVVTAPDCVNGGYTTYTCVCGHSYVDTYVDANGHSYNAVVTDPTCTTDGYTTYKCSVCGDTYVDNKVASKGHVKGDAVIEKEVKPTCETKGSYETVVYCTVCNAELDRTTAIVPKLGHTAGEAVEENRVESSCKVAGSYNEVVYCSVCKTHKMSETKVDLPLADHDYEAVVTDPTCTVAGCTTYTCSVCGYNYTDNVVNPLGHTNGTVVVENEKAPTCTATGSYDNVVYCTVCSAEISRETITVNALGHTEVTVPGKNATCTETGLTEGKMCSVCGTVTEEQETISAGHNYENGVCSNCGFRKTTATVSIQNYATANGWANESKHAEVEIDHNVIASLSGTDTYTGSYYTKDYSWRMYQTGTAKLTITASNNATIVSVKITYIIEKTGILTLDGKNITSGTVVEVNDSEIVFGVGNTSTATNGQVRITGIEVVYTGGLAPCEHKTDETLWGDGEITTAPTCVTTGIKTYTCAKCGDKKVEELDALDHIDENKDHVCDHAGCAVEQGTHADSNGDTICDYGCEEKIEANGPDLVQKTYTYTFTATQWSANGTKTLNNISWTLAGNGSYWGYDANKGQQFGSSKAPYKNMTLTSSSFTNVSKIIINTSGASSISGSVKVYVGSTLVKTITLAATANDYTIDVSDLSGVIKLEYTQTSSKAIYIKSIKVFYAE